MLTIERMSLTDIESFHAVLDAVARERRFLTVLEAGPLDDLRDWISKSLVAGNVHLMARNDDRAIGWCDICRHSYPIQSHRGTLGMGVLSRHRGIGVGDQLLSAALRAGWEAGFSRIELTVNADNPGAIRLYEKHGFQREGVFRKASITDGISRDEIAMAIVK